MQPTDDPTIETADGHRLTLWRRFGNPAFKHGSYDLRLLGWDPSGAILHLHAGDRSASPSVERWDVRTGERLPATLLTADAPVAGLSIDAACSVIIARRDDGFEDTELWDLRAGRRLATLRSWSGPNDVAVSADGRLAVRGRYQLDVYALPGVDLVASWTGDRPVAVSPDGSSTVSRASSRDADRPGRPRVSRPDGALVATLPPELAEAGAVAFTPDGRRLIVGLTDGEVACWELATGEVHWRVRPHGDDAPRAVLVVACAADGATVFALDGGDRLCALSTDGAVRWRAALSHHAKTSPTSAGQLLPSPDGTRLAVSLLGRSPRIIDAATGTDRTPVEGHGDRLGALAVSPDGLLAASGDDRGEVRVYDLARGEVRWTLEVEGERGCGLEFAPDGRALWTGGSDGCVRRWSLATGFEESHRGEPKEWGVRIAGARDGARMLVTGGGWVELWSDQTATPVHWAQELGVWKGLTAAFSDAESRVVVAVWGYQKFDRDDWSLVTLDAATGREVAEREEVAGEFRGLFPTDDGPLSVGVAEGRLVVRAAFGARREIAAREAPKGAWAPAISGDGRWLAHADDDDRVELWSLAPPFRCVARVRPSVESDAVARLALSHDGGVLVVGTACGVVAVYTRTANG